MNSFHNSSSPAQGPGAAASKVLPSQKNADHGGGRAYSGVVIEKRLPVHAERAEIRRFPAPVRVSQPGALAMPKAPESSVQSGAAASTELSLRPLRGRGPARSSTRGVGSGLDLDGVRSALNGVMALPPAERPALVERIPSLFPTLRLDDRLPALREVVRRLGTEELGLVLGSLIVMARVGPTAGGLPWAQADTALAWLRGEVPA